MVTLFLCRYVVCEYKKFDFIIDTFLVYDARSVIRKPFRLSCLFRGSEFQPPELESRVGKVYSSLLVFQTKCNNNYKVF